MGTNSEIIISNGEKTKSFYVNFGSHQDDLGIKLRKLVYNTNGNNWAEDLVKKLKCDEKFDVLSGTIPVNYIYLINQRKQILYKNDDGWKPLK